MTASTISPHWLCPDLRKHWVLGRDRTTGTYYLKARQSDHRHALSDAESYALSHFSGRFTVAQIQRLCERELDDVPPDFIQRLWQKLTDWGVLMANVEIKEEDLTFVERGAAVTFRPRQAKLDSYSARV